MPHTIGFVTDAGDFAHCNLVDTIRTFAAANGWTVLRNVSTTGAREIILKGTGLSGTEEIFIGFKTYTNDATGYYNIGVAAFMGYNSAAVFESQPNALIRYICLTKLRVDYWITLNGQRLAMTCKTTFATYESAYAGKFLPYGRPGEYPYPVVAGGTSSSSTTLASSTAITHCNYLGAASSNASGDFLNPGCGLYSPGGITSLAPLVYPYRHNRQGADKILIPESFGGNFALYPAELFDPAAPNWFGAFDGIHAISGRDAVQESTVTFNGKTYVMFNNVFRTDQLAFHAMRLD